MDNIGVKMLEKLIKSLVEAPVVKKGDYDYFVHPITDGVPLVEADLLQEVAEATSKYADLNVDKIVCVEAMGIHLATAISILTEIPFVVIRKRSYGLEGESAVHQTTGYSEGELYINGLEKGDRIFMVDDVVVTDQPSDTRCIRQQEPSPLRKLQQPKVSRTSTAYGYSDEFSLSRTKRATDPRGRQNEHHELRHLLTYRCSKLPPHTHDDNRRTLKNKTTTVDPQEYNA